MDTDHNHSLLSRSDHKNCGGPQEFAGLLVGVEGQLSDPKTPGQSSSPSTADTESDGQPTKRGRTALQKQTRLTVSQIDDLLARRAVGTTIAELATRFGIHRTTVMAHLKRNSP